MRHLFYKPIFLLFIFILFFLILNIFILSLLDNISVLNGFFTMYIFWFVLIIFLFFISRTLLKDELNKENDV